MQMIYDGKWFLIRILCNIMWFQYDLLRCKDGLNSVCFVPFGCILDDSKLGRTRRAVGRRIDGSSCGQTMAFSCWETLHVLDHGMMQWWIVPVAWVVLKVVDIIWVTCPFEYCPVGPVRPGLCGRCFNQRPRYKTQTLWGRFESFVHFGNRLNLR